MEYLKIAAHWPWAIVDVVVVVVVVGGNAVAVIGVVPAAGESLYISVQLDINYEIGTWLERQRLNEAPSAATLSLAEG